MAAYDLTGAMDVLQRDLFGALARQRCLEVAIDQLMERFGLVSSIAPTSLPGLRSLVRSHDLDFLDDREPVLAASWKRRADQTSAFRNRKAELGQH